MSVDATAVPLNVRYLLVSAFRIICTCELDMGSASDEWKIAADDNTRMRSWSFMMMVVVAVLLTIVQSASSSYCFCWWICVS